MRSLFAVAGSILLLAAGSSSLAAQEASGERVAVAIVPADSVAPCTVYAECALRVEPDLRRGAQLVRGVAGRVAATVDPIDRSEFTRLFAGNDSAAFHAQTYVRAERVNRILTLGGIVAGAVGLASERRMNGLTLAGAGMLLASIPYQAAAERGLSRAVWWYNAALAAPPAPR